MQEKRWIGFYCQKNIRSFCCIYSSSAAFRSSVLSSVPSDAKPDVPSGCFARRHFVDLSGTDTHRVIQTVSTVSHNVIITLADRERTDATSFSHRIASSYAAASAGTR
jgi:hypothetical protein